MTFTFSVSHASLSLMFTFFSVDVTDAGLGESERVLGVWGGDVLIGGEMLRELGDD